MNMLTMTEAREILREADAERLYTESELIDSVREANNHPARDARDVFESWVFEELRVSACESAEAARAGD
jgi:hypothetical protein